ncbi:hypothetical protein BJY01DRAFT_250645 [Aspergillus pseudoustus]|uniref:Uncharacterized protein n=1 Tax=Aspergillus pseudoustus TaxID=1810923 RepID=A0ABR4JGJ8_9EURO
MFDTSIAQDPSHILAAPRTSTQSQSQSPLEPMLLKPIVIPQVSRSARSEIMIPFLRAYSPALSACKITEPDFLAFLDGLNEAWIANPVLQATSIAGSVMGMIHPVEIPGMVIETVSEAASEGSSYLRTRRYLKKVNESMFEPRGLRVKICGFKDMLGVVGVTETWVRGCLELRKRKTGNGRGECDRDDDDVTLEELENLLEAAEETDVERSHPRLQMLQALEGYVAPLERVGLPVNMEKPNMLRRWNASFAAKEEQKRTAGMEKKYDEMRKRRAEKYREAINEVLRKNREIERLDEKITKAQASRAHSDKETAKKIERLTAEIDKIERRKQERVRQKLESANENREKLEQKEWEDTRKIKWLLITSIERKAPVSGV